MGGIDGPNEMGSADETEDKTKQKPDYSKGEKERKREGCEAAKAKGERWSGGRAKRRSVLAVGLVER